MPRYVALIRAINVGGTGVLAMSELKKMFESLGLSSVTTYIQSGNVVFESTATDRRRLAGQLEQALQRVLDRPATVFVLTPAELKKAAAHNPFGVPDEQQRCQMMFLSGAPDAKHCAALLALAGDSYRFHVHGRVLYYAYPSQQAGRRRSIDFEKVLDVVGTSRNCNVVNELIELAR